MCFPHEASEQSNGVCMIFLPLVDLLFLIGSSIAAFLNRGTLVGWMCTFLVIWQVWNLIKFVRAHP